jgi:hypothetical protein
VGSTMRTVPSAARNSFFSTPGLLNISASGGPEIVVVE